QERMGRFPACVKGGASGQQSGSKSGSKSIGTKRLERTFLNKGFSNCPFCEGTHEPTRCALSHKERWEVCRRKDKPKCFRCLEPFAPSKGRRHYCKQVVCGLNGCRRN